VSAAALAGGSPRRVGAILLRHVYLWRGSWTRIFDLLYWPTLQMTIWGFMTMFLAGKSSWVAQAGGVFIGAVLLWDVLVRSQFGSRCRCSRSCGLATSPTCSSPRSAPGSSVWR
jgi:hypothetical protein